MGKFVGGILAGVVFGKAFAVSRKFKKSILKEFLKNPDDFEITEYVEDDEIVIKIRKRVCE